MQWIRRNLIALLLAFIVFFVVVLSVLCRRFNIRFFLTCPHVYAFSPQRPGCITHLEGKQFYQYGGKPYCVLHGAP